MIFGIITVKKPSSVGCLDAAEPPAEHTIDDAVKGRKVRFVSKMPPGLFHMRERPSFIAGRFAVH